MYATEITLVSATIATSNPTHAQTIRNPMANISSKQEDDILQERLKYGNVNPTLLQEIAMQGAGLNRIPEAYGILEDGWGEPHGILHMKFVVSENSAYSRTIDVIGYMYGGDPITAEGIDDTAMFSPVKTWEQIDQQALDRTGLPINHREVKSASHFFVSQSSQNASSLIRPKDILNGASTIAATRMYDDDGDLGNGEPYVPSGAASDLSAIGLTMTSASNINHITHTAKVLDGSTRALASYQTNRDEYKAWTDGLSSGLIRDASPESNLFIAAMKHNLGVSSFRGFSGFTIGEICDVFENFPEIVSVRLTETAYIDHRISTNALGGSSDEEVLCDEAISIIRSIMFEKRLSIFQIVAHNNAAFGTNNLNNVLNVTSYTGPHITTFLDNDDLVRLAAEAEEAFVNSFFSKLSTIYSHRYVICNIKITANILGDIEVELFLGGDENNAEIWRDAKPIWADKNFSNMLARQDHGVEQINTFYQNVCDRFR